LPSGSTCAWCSVTRAAIRLPSGNATVTSVPGAVYAVSSWARHTDRRRVGDIRLEVIRPRIRLPSTIWLASGGTTVASTGCSPTRRGPRPDSCCQTSSGLPTKSSLSSFTAQSSPAL
jgi:hypothetical protein